MKRAVLALFSLLILVAAAPAFAQCTTIDDGKNSLLPSVFAGETNVYFTQAADNLQNVPPSLPLPTSLTDTALREAGEWWQTKCPASQFPNLPNYSYKGSLGSGDRALPVRLFNSFPPLPPGCPSPSASCGQRIAGFATTAEGIGELWIYNKCLPEYIQGGVCDANDSPNWNEPFWWAVLAHELGHANGLGHDREGGQCSSVRSLMRGNVWDMGLDMRNGEYCRVADEQNCDPSNASGCGGPHSVMGTVSGLDINNTEFVSIELSAVVNNQKVSTIVGASAANPAIFSQPVFPPGVTVMSALVFISNTNKTCDFPIFQMPNGHYQNYSVTCRCSTPAPTSGAVATTSGDEICPDEDDEDEDPRDIIETPPPVCEFCDLNPTLDPWWKGRSGPKKENCTTDCKFVRRECVDIFDTVTGELIETACSDFYECKPVCTPAPESSFLYGPTVSLTSPPRGTTVSGRTLISGYGNDQQGLQNTYFFLDGNLVELEERQSGVHTPEACSGWNKPTPCNPYVGFRGYLNFGNVSPGAHKLEVLVTDADPDYPVPTVYEMPIQVGSCDTVSRAITITSPADGATVDGIVTVTAVPNDNVAVDKGDLYVDGVYRATDGGAPPFTFLWDSRTVANGSHTLSVRDHDGCINNSQSPSITLTVDNGTNRKPIARNDRAATRIGMPVTIRALDNDEDPDGQAITLTDRAIRTNPRNGTAVKISSGSITYTPNAQWSGNDIFEYEIADTSGKRDWAWVAVHVGRTKNLPVLTDDNATTPSNQSITIDVIANDAPGGGTVFLTGKPILTKPRHGVATRLSDRELSYTPKADFVGQDVFAYEASDIEGDTVAAFVNVTVTRGNHPPAANNDGPVFTSIGKAVNIDVVSNDTDPDDDILTLWAKPFVDVSTNGPHNGTVVRANDRVVTYTPNVGFSGTDTFRYGISDGQDGNAEASVTVTVTTDANNPPTAEDDAATTAAGTAVTINVIANDFDVDGHRVRVSSIVLPPANGTAVTISNDAITYTPKAGFTGTDRFEYEAVDEGGLRDRAFVDVTVSESSTNRNPVAVDDLVTMKENTSADVIVTANDSDPDGDTLMLTVNYLKAGPWSGTLTRVSNTKVRYTPNPDFVGADSFHYEITDAADPAKKAHAWVYVTVRNANTRPVAVDDIASTKSGQSVTIDVVKNDSDPDGDTIRLRSGGDAIDKPPLYGTATKVDDQSIKYIPGGGFQGTDRFRYEIADGKGGRHTAWVNITVTSGSAPGVASMGIATMSEAGLPPVADNDSAETLVGEEVSVVVLSNDRSPTGHSVILANPAVITPPLYGTVTRVSDTVLTYTSWPTFTGNDRFEYAVVDAQGETTRAWVTVQLPGDNQPPVAVDDTVPVGIGQTVTIRPLTNDTDPNQDPLALTTRGLTVEPLHGIARRISDTELVYEPGPDFTGMDVLTYEMTDGRGGIAEAKVILIVTNGSVPPIAQDDTVTAESGWTVVIDVLANDSDPDGGALRIVSSVPPSRGTLLWTSDREAVYQSDRGFSGSDSFRYTISDEHGLVDEAQVSITVAVTNHPPIANNDVAETKTRTPVLIGVLVNDGDIDYLQKLKVVGVTQPAHGTAAVNNLQSVTYTPANNFAGTDTFTYTVSDGKAPVKATVTVTVVNGPPNVRGETLAAREDQPTPYYPSIHLLNNDTDPDGDELAVTQVEQPVHGTIQVAPDFSTIAYTSRLNWSGVDTFHYTVSDPFGESVRVMSSISVSAVNDAPVAGNDSFTMYNNQVLTLTQAQVVANDTDLEGHAISVYSVEAPTNGTAEKLADGSIRYEPHGSFVGTDSFKYRIEDSAGGAYAEGVITVTVLSDTRPVASFTFSCNYLVCSFDASASTDDRGITSYQWTLGDGRAASGKTFSHTYSGSGTYTARVTVYDALGQTGTITKSVTVVSGNTPPAAVHDSFGGAEDQTIGFYGSTLLANDVDAEGNTPLRITAVTLPTKGTLTYPADFSTFIYQPNANWFGTDSFTYTVSDSLGATAQTTVTLNVNSVNDGPVAVNDSFSVYKNQLLTMTQAQIVANDTDLEGHTITIYAVGAATNGTTLKLANGSIEYRPYGEFVGTDSFEYTIQDSAGGAYGFGRVNVNVMQDTAPVASFTYSCTNLTCAFNASASTDDRGILTWQWTMGNNQSASGATFNYTYGAAGSYTVRLTVTDALGQTGIISKVVTVTLPNAPPTAANDSFSGPEDGVISFSGGQLLANDTDSDGNTPLRITAVTLPANGTLTYPADFSSFSFRSNANWFGTSSFTYTVADSLGATAQGTVQLTVSSVNDGPVAGTDSFTVYKNQLLTITPQQLLVNDSDHEGHPISVFAVGGAVNGTVQQLADGNIEYRPSNEFVGAGSFDYTLRDSFGASTSGRVNITVLQDNPPVANFNVTCNGRVCSFDASATTDDRGITSYQWTLGNNTPANGKTFTYTYPVAGTYQVRLTVWDTLGQTSIAAKWVTPTEPPPDAVNDSFSFSKGYARSVFYVDMLRNDTDPNGDTLSVISNSAASIGTVTCDATSCRFQPPSQYWYGQSTFTYTISDGHGKTDTATVTIEFRF